MDRSRPDAPQPAAGRDAPESARPLLDYAARVRVSRLARWRDDWPLLLGAVPGLAIAGFGLYWAWYAETEAPAADRGGHDFMAAVVTLIGIAMVWLCTPWFWRALKFLRSGNRKGKR